MSLLSVLLAGFALPVPASAQQVTAVEIRLDNDFLAIRGRGAPPDFDYSHGLRVKAQLDSFPSRLHRHLVADGRELRTHVAIGQQIYTPRQDAGEPVPGERPYAGWLFLGAGMVVTGGPVEHRVDLEVGLTGPAAMGEQVQNGFHRLVGSSLQEGWDHQLRREMAGTVRYGVNGVHAFGGVRLRPHVEIGLGTLWSGAASGLEVRSGAGAGARGLSAGAAVRQEWVARNLFLDGNTVRPAVRAEKRSRVSEGAVNLAYAFQRWDVEYRYVLRSREYEAQPRAHGYGSIGVSWRRPATH